SRPSCHHRSKLLRRPHPTLFPYTTLFRSGRPFAADGFFPPLPPVSPSPDPELSPICWRHRSENCPTAAWRRLLTVPSGISRMSRSEEHTSELQSRENLVCRLLLEKKNDYM